MGCSISKRIHETEEDLDAKGVSIHHLKHVLLPEIDSCPGLSGESTIYDLEDLKSKEHGFIRRQGANTTCPVDGKIGSRYVDAIHGKDHVGKANVMLSYTWKYAIGDIVDTLWEFCETHKHDPKRTYVWLCCLCINQHRVYKMKHDVSREENQQAQPQVKEEVQQSVQQNNQTLTTIQRRSGEKAFQEFQSTFRDRVLGVDTVVIMMFPWDNPAYLGRIWCIFELYTAHSENCNVEIIMPAKERDKMTTALTEVTDGIDVLYDTLLRTNIEEAKASVELDRQRILELVRTGPGFNTLNNAVNDLLRQWVNKGILEGVSRRETQLEDASSDGGFGLFCGQLGIILEKNGQYDAAIELHKKCLGVFLKVEDKETAASAYHNLGKAYVMKQSYEEALAEYRKAVELDKEMHGEDHPDVATTYGAIADALRYLERYDESLAETEKVLAIRLNIHGPDHVDTAMTYGALGMIHHAKKDYTSALAEFEKSLQINVATYGEDHPETATCLHNVAGALCELERYEEAYEKVSKSLDIRLKVLGADHPKTSSTVWWKKEITNLMKKA
jgi:tetratricopeptide (TPR) repeat protein